MNATAVRNKRQVTLPQAVCEQANIGPGDRIAWVYEDGIIRGRKLVQDADEVLDLKDLHPKTLLPKKGKILPESLARSIRADREGR